MDLQDEDGWSALIHASQRGRCDIVTLLLENGASTELQDHHGNSALTCASQKWRSEVAELLLECGTDADLLNKRWLLCTHGGQQTWAQPVWSRCCLGRGCRSTCRTRKASLPSHGDASQQGHCQVAKLLVEEGALVYLKGRSALLSWQSTLKWQRFCCELALRLILISSNL